MQLIVSDQSTGKSYKINIENDRLAGREVGEKIDGSIVGLDGYTIKITGGSDSTGRPMREDVSGSMVRQVLMKGDSVGFNPQRDGERKRKAVRGRRIEDEIVQVNSKIVERGEKSVEELLGREEEEE